MGINGINTGNKSVPPTKEAACSAAPNNGPAERLSKENATVARFDPAVIQANGSTFELLALKKSLEDCARHGLDKGSEVTFLGVLKQLFEGRVEFYKKNGGRFTKDWRGDTERYEALRAGLAADLRSKMPTQDLGTLNARMLNKINEKNDQLLQRDLAWKLEKRFFRNDDPKFKDKQWLQQQLIWFYQDFKDTLRIADLLKRGKPLDKVDLTRVEFDKADDRIFAIIDFFKQAAKEYTYLQENANDNNANYEVDPECNVNIGKKTEADYQTLLADLCQCFFALIDEENDYMFTHDATGKGSVSELHRLADQYSVSYVNDPDEQETLIHVCRTDRRNEFNTDSTSKLYFGRPQASVGVMLNVLADFFDQTAFKNRIRFERNPENNLIIQKARAAQAAGFEDESELNMNVNLQINREDIFGSHNTAEKRLIDALAYRNLSISKFKGSSISAEQANELIRPLTSIDSLQNFATDLYKIFENAGMLETDILEADEIIGNKGFVAKDLSIDNLLLAVGGIGGYIVDLEEPEERPEPKVLAKVSDDLNDLFKKYKILTPRENVIYSQQLAKAQKLVVKAGNDREVPLQNIQDFKSEVLDVQFFFESPLEAVQAFLETVKAFKKDEFTGQGGELEGFYRDLDAGKTGKMIFKPMFIGDQDKPGISITKD